MKTKSKKKQIDTFKSACISINKKTKQWRKDFYAKKKKKVSCECEKKITDKHICCQWGRRCYCECKKCTVARDQLDLEHKQWLASNMALKERQDARREADYQALKKRDEEMDKKEPGSAQRRREALWAEQAKQHMPDRAFGFCTCYECKVKMGYETPYEGGRRW